MAIIAQLMPFPVGTRIGPFEIVAPLGAGGMGEVFRARDTKLGRDVALKILPAVFASDPDRLMRFAREAKTLAALNHPHIAQVYGLEDVSADTASGGSRALVMELVEGQDLSARIERGPLPVDEALHIARQIADALEAAHEHGIIHRDLKPANIKLKADGTVKVLDFGLAKALDPAGESMEQANSPTLTSPALTMRGVILGTAAYMAPEQAKGKAVDRRADMWAFGCVLYEMLAGRRAFEGEDTTDTIAAVVTRDPDWTRLPSSTPDSVRRLLRRCLTKPVRERLRSMGDAALEIAEATRPNDISTSGPVRQPLKPFVGVRSWRSAVAASVVLLSVAAIGWFLGRRQTTATATPLSAVRLSLVPSESDAISVSGNDRDLAISPDGKRVAYVGGHGTALVVRDLDRNEAVRIPGVGLPHNPFFSPDGTWVGFADGLSAIKRVSARGGPVETVCRITQPSVQGSWHGDTIVFAQYGRIFRVAARGGVPEALTPPPGAEQSSLYNPSFLPGGKAVLVGVAPRRSGTAEAGIGVVDLQTGVLKMVVPLGPSPGGVNGLVARFIAPRHLIYRPQIEPGARSAPALRVIGFDLTRLETVGTAAVLDEPVFITAFGGYADFDVAQNGTLLYVSAAASPEVRRLVWVDRSGREEPIDLPARAYTYPNFSPDGRQVALDIRDQENDGWIWDLGRNTLRRLTFDPGFNQYAIWTHDQQRIADIVGNTIFWQRADGSGRPEVLAERPHLLAPYAFSQGDRHLVFREDFPETGHDLMMLSLDADRKVVPLLQTRFNELNAEISPDGRWLAYESDESGSPDIYVRPFPDVNAGHWQVSAAGGRAPRWSRDGQELYFLALDGAMMATRVETAQAFVSHAAAQLFAHHNYVGGASSIGRTYDVSPDGRRFLMIKPAPSPNIAVVLNWAQTLSSNAR
jgi:serine/threonine protein kinase